MVRKGRVGEPEDVNLIGDGDDTAGRKHPQAELACQNRNGIADSEVRGLRVYLDA